MTDLSTPAPRSGMVTSQTLADIQEALRAKIDPTALAEAYNHLAYLWSNGRSDAANSPAFSETYHELVLDTVIEVFEQHNITDPAAVSTHLRMALAARELSPNK